MRTVGAGETAQVSKIADSSWVRLQVEDHLGALQDITDDNVEVEHEQTTDEWVDACTIRFRRRSGASSNAPLMTANPPIDVGRDVVVSIDPGAGTWREVFRGRIDKIDWPERFGDVVAYCSDQGGEIADTWIETVRNYGSDAGVALETVMQSVATDNLTSPPTIYVPVSPGALVTPAYEQQEEGVLQAERTLAETIGWVIRWRWIDSLTAWRWTLFEPSRSKVTPDRTFGTSDYYDVSQMGKDITDIRNVVKVEYSDSAGVRQSVTVTDSASITKYGRRAMKISLASDDPVRDSTRATKLANAALSDLKEPQAILEITAPYFWPGEIGVDLYRFSANGEHFSSDQDLAPVTFRHRLAIGQRAETKILCRGKPSGGVLMWRRKRALTKPDEQLITAQGTAYDTAHVSGTTSGKVRDQAKASAQNLLDKDAGPERTHTTNTPAYVSVLLSDARLSVGETISFGVEAKNTVNATVECRVAFFDSGGTSLLVNHTEPDVSVLGSYTAVKVENLTIPANTHRIDVRAQRTSGTEGDTWHTRRWMLARGPILPPFEEPPFRYQRERNLPAGTNADGDFYTLAANPPKVGTSGSPSSITKKIRFAHTFFRPSSDSVGFIHNSDYLQSTSLASQLFLATFEVPPGVTITSMAANLYRETASDVARWHCVRLNNDHTGSAIVPQWQAHSTTAAYQDVSYTLSETVGEDVTYVIIVELDPAASTSDTRLAWMTVTYTMPSYDKGI